MGQPEAAFPSAQLAEPNAIGRAVQPDPAQASQYCPRCSARLEPLKCKLYRVDPGVKIFRCKFMTAPGCQFDVRTAALKKIEAALVEAEIPFAGAGPQTILVRRARGP